MSLQLDEILCEIRVEPPIRDVPELDGAVLGRRGDDVVVERVPLDVQHGTAVAGDLEKGGKFLKRESGICELRTLQYNVDL